VFRSTRYGDDKDRVILRSTGEAAPTYFAADIGYLAEKFSRGYQRIVFIWGEDHHGYVARVKAAAQSLGFDRDQVRMILTAWVRFERDGKEVAMSKRAGEFITLDELLGEIGVDAARWFFASRAASSGIDFDIELAKKQSSENPVYYVQYAHARIASILRKAAASGMDLPAGDDPRLAGLLTDILHGAPEALLARQIVRLPEVVEDAAVSEETHGITSYATELATAFHAFYRDARVIDEAEPDRSAGRLALAAATKTTLANALGLLGISAPDSM
jgi:arginyl-tRNA synthetase